MSGSPAGEPLLRALPAVHELAAALDAPHALAVAVARATIDEHRAQVLAGADRDADLRPRARALLAQRRHGSLRRVLNATGVILHTNLGRAPLAASARRAVAVAAEGYGNLELDLSTGRRGSRQTHVESLLRELTGAPAAMVVNNGAAAVLLAAAALAGPGRAVLVSRGQLVEIGGGFRIPDVIAQSGSQLLEVGTTNRTQLRDYERALEASAGPAGACAGSRAVASGGSPVGAILRVHRSNFAMLGFVEDVAIEALCGLGLPVIDDVGSGVLLDGEPLALEALAQEPALKRSVGAGAALVCCSGDKLLGGPQAGLLVGTAAAIAAASTHPLARALRIDKLSLAALEATLMLYRDPMQARREIPVLAMLEATEERLLGRAQRLRHGLGARTEIVRTTARVGGGALPLLELEGPAVALGLEQHPAAVARALRAADPPLIARIHDGRVQLDPRTLGDEEIEPAIAAVAAAIVSLAKA